jgi:hypothetical protein
MIETITKEELLKRNLLALAKEHRDNCDRHCTVNLSLILEIALKAGLAIEEKDKWLFL